MGQVISAYLPDDDICFLEQDAREFRVTLNDKFAEVMRIAVFACMTGNFKVQPVKVDGAIVDLELGPSDIAILQQIADRDHVDIDTVAQYCLIIGVEAEKKDHDRRDRATKQSQKNQRRLLPLKLQLDLRQYFTGAH